MQIILLIVLLAGLYGVVTLVMLVPHLKSRGVQRIRRSTLKLCDADFECEKCFTCVGHHCLSLTPENSKPCAYPLFENELQLYFKFYYDVSVELAPIRCSDYGTYVEIVKRIPEQANITKEEYERNQTNIVQRIEVCHRREWAFTPYLPHPQKSNEP